MGRDGAVARERRVTGLTQSWTHLVQLSEDFVLFYRNRDEYVVVVRWEQDGKIVDEYSPSSFGLGWTHLTRIGTGELVAYSASDGRAQVVSYEADTTITRQEALTGMRPGWSHHVRVSDGRLLQYDAMTGEAEVQGIAPDGIPTPEGRIDLGAGWTSVVQLDEGLIALGAGETGSLRLVDLRAGSAAIVDETTTDPWTTAFSPVSGQVVLYNAVTGLGRQVELERVALKVGPVVALPAGSNAIVSRP